MQTRQDKGIAHHHHCWQPPNEPPPGMLAEMPAQEMHVEIDFRQDDRQQQWNKNPVYQINRRLNWLAENVGYNRWAHLGAGHNPQAGPRQLDQGQNTLPRDERA